MPFWPDSGSRTLSGRSPAPAQAVAATAAAQAGTTRMETGGALAVAL